MGQKDCKALDILMGNDEKEIFEKLGKPLRSWNSVKIYKGKTGSTLAIVFHSPEGRTVVKALVLFSTTGEVLHVRGVNLLEEEAVAKAKSIETFEQAQDILGEAATDIGSGQQILAYFTNKAQLLMLYQAGKKNLEWKLLSLTEEVAKC